MKEYVIIFRMKDGEDLPTPHMDKVDAWDMFSLISEKSACMDCISIDLVYFPIIGDREVIARMPCYKEV